MACQTEAFSGQVLGLHYESLRGFPEKSPCTHCSFALIAVRAVNGDTLIKLVHKRCGAGGVVRSRKLVRQCLGQLTRPIAGITAFLLVAVGPIHIAQYGITIS